MKIIDLKKVNSILLVMVIFLSYQIPVWADTDHTTVKIPVQRSFPVKLRIFRVDVLMYDNESGRCPYAGRKQEYEVFLENGK